MIAQCVLTLFSFLPPRGRPCFLQLRPCFLQLHEDSCPVCRRSEVRVTPSDLSCRRQHKSLGGHKKKLGSWSRGGHKKKWVVMVARGSWSLTHPWSDPVWVDRVWSVGFGKNRMRFESQGTGSSSPHPL